MSQVKMPYYPKVLASCTETVFGSVEMSCPTLYDKPIDGLTIIKVDLLECLRNIVGDNCMLYRDLFYKLVAGSCVTMDEHLTLFESAYRRYAEFTAYVNNIYYYGESTIPLVPRVLNELREKIDTYCEEVTQVLDGSGGKFLMHTHDFLVYSFKPGLTIPRLEGSITIC